MINETVGGMKQVPSEKMWGGVSRNTSTTIKGVWAFIILYHHLIYKIPRLPLFVEPFKYIAFPIVATFFFFSGYGLYKGLEKGGEKYWDSYFKRRGSRILLPLLVVEGIWGAFSLCLKRSPILIIKEMTTIDFIPAMWYIWVSLGVYVVFYVAFKYFDRNIGIGIMGVSIVAYITIWCFTVKREPMVASISSVLVGVLVAKDEKNIVKWLSSRYMCKVVCLGIVSIGLFVLRLIISLKITDDIFVHTALRNLISCIFVFFVFFVALKIEIKKNILVYIGGISFEIYLIHPFLIYALTLLEGSGRSISIAVYLLGVPLITIVLSILFNKGMTLVYKK